MNITETEVPLEIVAKTCSCSDKNRKVTYLILDSYYSICREKKDIIISQLTACEKLLKYSIDTIDKKIIEKEINELKLILDLIH
jgi:hypothetical protein